MIRVKDLDDWRSDYEMGFLVIAVMLGVVGGSVLYLPISAYGWRPKWPGPGDPGDLLTGILLSSGALACLYRFHRTRSKARVLRIDPGARTYEVVVGRFHPEVLWSGRFDDFAGVRLATKVRRVFGRRYVSRCEFWTVSLVWKDVDRRPFCLEEVRGAVVTPEPWGPKPLYRGEYHRAQAALVRWGKELGIPAVDTTLNPDRTGLA